MLNRGVDVRHNSPSDDVDFREQETASRELAKLGLGALKVFSESAAVLKHTGVMRDEKSTAMEMVVASGISKNDRFTFFEEKLFKNESPLLKGALFDVKGTTIQVDTLVCDYPWRSV